MRPRTTRLRAATAVALMVINGGCGAENPAPQPEPKPRYAQIPRDLCERLRFGDLFTRLGLSPVSSYEPGSDYRTERTYWWERCSFIGQARDGRFATKLGDFRPSGAVEVQVHHDVAGAEKAYDQDAENYFDYREKNVPGTTTTDLPGWWGESGRSLEWVRVLNPDDYTLGDFAATRVDVTHLIRHENLVVMVYGGAVSPTRDTAEALALLHELATALIDEAATQLGR